MSADSILQLDRLNVQYGSKRAVRDVTLTVKRGDVYALLGRNGAGKSSLIRCLLGLQKPSSGSVLFNGKSTWRDRQHVMQHIGVVPEEPDAPPEMTVEQIVNFCRALYPKWNQSEVQARLERFAVPQTTPFGTLSKGQKGQVNLALALAFEPELLVLDDPTLGLDAVARRAFFEELIGDLADRGTTVFMTTHDLAAAESLVTHVGILLEGELVLDEAADSLKQRFRRIRVSEPASEAALEPLRAVATRSSALGVEADVTNYDDSLFAEWRARRALPAEVGSMSLEEIFVAVAGEHGKPSNGPSKETR
jgi:ABC-2 type transport system ATP-binding protein